MLTRSVRLREPGRDCGRKFVRDSLILSVAGLIICYNIGAVGEQDSSSAKQISCAGRAKHISLERGHGTEEGVLPVEVKSSNGAVRIRLMRCWSRSRYAVE